MKLRHRFQLWRHRPGLILAARLIEQQAWSHQHAGELGPEVRLMNVSESIRDRLRAAEQGDITGLCLNATSPTKRKTR